MAITRSTSRTSQCIAPLVVPKGVMAGHRLATSGRNRRRVGSGARSTWISRASSSSSAVGGALRKDQQGKRAGVDGARQTFSWMFETLKLELLVATGALDNIRTARLLDRLGFDRKGEITSTRADGSTRQSLVWEVSRSQWQAMSR